MIAGVNNIGLAVRDLEASLEFYQILGFEIVHRDETPAATIRAGSAVLYVFQTTEKTEPVSRDLELVHNPPGIDHISFDVSDVDELYARLNGKISFEGPPENQPWGYRATSALDPDGNRVYFLSALK